MTAGLERLVMIAEDDRTDPGLLGTALAELLARSPAIGAAVALGLLAREPRIKPSRRLLVDPQDEAYRRWLRRVTAAAALLGSPVAADVRHELRDELAENPDLDNEARALVTGATGVT